MSERHLLLGVTGGIAAYKTPELIRLFQKENIQVKVVATRHALEFVTPVTLEAISGAPLYSGTFEKNAGSIDHVELAGWTDVMVVAPATANSVAKFACGVADDLLSTIFVAMKRPVVVAPAMNDAMLTDNTVMANINALHHQGVKIVDPGFGQLACGTVGPGRMAELEQIVSSAKLLFKERSALEGLKVLVTAGATREHLDPVRFLSNRSTGKMGYAVAAALIKFGADVTLVTGPTSLYPPAGADVVRITSAQDMHDEVMKRCDARDVIIKAAAVADYTPAEASEHKIKKSGDGMTLTLKRTPDILGGLGRIKKKGQTLVGFSAETQNHLENSVKKLEKKNLDLIVLNDVASKDSGFEVDTNRVMFIRPIRDEADEARPSSGGVEMFKTVGDTRIGVQATPLLSKSAVAEALVRKIIEIR